MKTEKLYYSIREIATMFNVAPSLLRFWEKEFEYISPKKNSKGTRFYSKENIENIKQIYFLVKEKGMTLDGAKKCLKNNKNGVYNQQQIIERLTNIKQQLSEIKKALDEEDN